MCSDKDQIRQVFEEAYPQYMRTKDMAGYVSMYTEDAVWMPPNSPDRYGIPEIMEGFANTIKDKDIDPVFSAEEIEVMGDFGYIMGYSLATIQTKDSSTSNAVKYRALWLMKKEHGSWKVYRQIWNTKP
jgi:uncharacterized protein (TIGR02246 family)